MAKYFLRINTDFHGLGRVCTEPGDLYTESGQTLHDSFSAVSKHVNIVDLVKSFSTNI